MVALAATASIRVVAVTPVVCTTTVSTLRNSKLRRHFANSFSFFSHPGYFGKCGVRWFHMKPNQTWNPTINCNKLWNLVGEEARAQSKDGKGAVIDVTKYVRQS